MRDDGNSGDAQERRGDVRVVIHPAPELRDPAERNETRKLSERPAEDIATNAFNEDVDDTLHTLGEDIAGEAVGDADVGDAARHVAALDVAVEVEILRALEERVRGELHASALLGLLTDVDKTDGRPVDGVHLLHEARCHARELKDVVLVGVHRGARIEEARRLPLRRRQHPAERGAIDPADAAEDQEGRRHRGASVAGGHHSVGFAVLDHRGRDTDRGIRAPSERRRGMLVHSDDVLRAADRDARGSFGAQGLADGILAPDEHEVRHTALFPIQQSAPDYLVRGVVAAHRVDGDFHQSAAVLGGRPLGLDRYDLAAAERAAVRARLVRRLRTLALRARNEVHRA